MKTAHFRVPVSPRSVTSIVITTLLLTAHSAYAAQTQINKEGINHSGSIGDDVLYSVGGGRAVSMGGSASMDSISVGAGWDTNLICGDMSLDTTLQNQLNGATRGFKSIMGNIIQNATSAVASLPALIIQRADPGLYNLLTNGILQARLDFDRSKSTCRAVAERMADIAGGQLGWGQLAEGMALSHTVKNHDAVAAVEQAEANRGNNGVPWIGGQSAGGRRQPPIKVVSDVTRAGFNLLNGRDAGNRTPIPKNSCGNRLSCQTWSSPQEAEAWATRVLGEREHQTCDNCTKTQTKPGVGLTPLIQEEYEAKLQVLEALIKGSKPTSAEHLMAAGSQSLPITRGVIEALRDEPDQDLLAKRLASEIALSSVLEKALLLQRTLFTGRKEPNVAANQLAQQAINTESESLTQEINNLKTELELRRTLASNSPMMLIQRQSERAAASRGVYQGDPVRNRLDLIQQTVPEGQSR
ncbi:MULTISPECIES: integrating conjugative element protein [unclassified Pseudomonas]|uniref:integrating conjugative element protein n=1 Tax=unclassified Pseudomonas TaxID=196821 RepID=UPI000876B728|nr:MULTISPECIES: integrating conjugative element protein [unclassified Pseudomonas]SCZ40095.1 integrating conjugative element protein, PFL_4711 family [Pseudomonas sp. NFACC44-2]SDA89961.1 integrating conjugative element protein, PFL_4711 family [Pseudomonas sp. NFACC51]SDW41130.1 integrating conjugative element protein, PFL_4711 family [Pseudomonas sp. NFACC08-1]SFI18118.1 integrating conjugative element protein, PFL_4711 family [Pseudomonas sp. NFACC54]SFT28553.1 integrating conjugative elem